jgi:LmbE family N-acetylglucosaminyl deacetylase
MMNVLCVVAHPDDEILGCGATLRKLRDQGHQVASCVLCSSADARHARPDAARLREVSATAARIVGIEETMTFDFPNIRLNTVPHLDVVVAIEEAIVKFRPNWVFTHHAGDLNIDHRVVHEACMAAVTLPLRLSRDLPVTMIQRVYLCEIPSSTDWASPRDPAFRPTSFFDVEGTFERKLAALDAFDGALKPFPHSRSRENVIHQAHVRGAQAGLALAEAFDLVRDINV